MDFIHDPLFPDQAQELLEAIREYDENRSSGPRHQSENQDQSKITTSQPITTLSQHIYMMRISDDCFDLIVLP